MASILYFHAYGHDLPLRDYRKQDIEYIIQQLLSVEEEGLDPFSGQLVH
ncbi:hypothetical protein [Cytobacillus depressus]|nr:hypothetical protein [Cytobacillus depressus]